jgi:CheY-like chemotaxis protein
VSSPGTQLKSQSTAEPKPKLQALLVEHNPLDAELVLRALGSDGFDISSVLVQDEAGFTEALRANRAEIVLADYNLPNWKGMEALAILRREGLDIPMIVVSSALGDVNAVECIKQGATDYVLKDGLARLPAVVCRALREKTERTRRRQAEEDLACKCAWSRLTPSYWPNAITASSTRMPTSLSPMPAKARSACKCSFTTCWHFRESEERKLAKASIAMR